jgi:Fusaric acid resistance protein family
MERGFGKCGKGRGSPAGLWAAALGLGLSSSLHRFLARARQSVLGRHYSRDCVSAPAWCFAAQGVVPHDRHFCRRPAVIVVLTAWFPQDRVLFLVALALWGAACALVATLLHNFASYAAALAGYTAATRRR